VDREQRNWCVGGVSEASLALGNECHMHHLLNGIVKLTSNDGSCPWCHGVDGYLYPDLTTIQATGLKRTTVVDGDRPVEGEVNKGAQPSTLREQWG
jgi:hypothetical protein